MKIILVLFPGFIAIAICYFVVVAAAGFFFFFFLFSEFPEVLLESLCSLLYTVTHVSAQLS